MPSTSSISSTSGTGGTEAHHVHPSRSQDGRASDRSPLANRLSSATRCSDAASRKFVMYTNQIKSQGTSGGAGGAGGEDNDKPKSESSKHKSAFGSLNPRKKKDK